MEDAKNRFQIHSLKERRGSNFAFQKCNTCEAESDFVQWKIVRRYHLRPHDDIVEPTQNLVPVQEFPTTLLPCGCVIKILVRQRIMSMSMRSALERRYRYLHSMNVRSSMWQCARRSRANFTSEQVRILTQQFEQNNYLTSLERASLSRKIGMSEQQVKIWYQNRRYKIKQMEQMQSESKAITIETTDEMKQVQKE